MCNFVRYLCITISVYVCMYVCMCDVRLYVSGFQILLKTFLTDFFNTKILLNLSYTARKIHYNIVK